MVNFIKTQTSFANGEVSPNFYANSDIHGLSRMENMDVIPGGCLRRRPGLKQITKLSGNARLVPFSVSENENYILAIMNGMVRIFSGDSFIQDIVAPWSFSDANILQYAQRFGTMIFVHPDYKPKILYRDNGVFKFADFDFISTDGNNNIDMPFMRFEDSENVNITVVVSDNMVHLRTNQDFWTPENVGGHLSLTDRTWIVTSYIDARDITATCNNGFTVPNAPVTDWAEAVFSPRRGWPTSITFHQDRLVFGGSKSWPGGVWMSCVGNHKSFNTGTGLDDQAIYITLVSGRRQHICTMVSADNLQVFTSDGEWAISNKPLTPESVDIKMHTNIGCVSERYLPPQEMDGLTAFVSKNRRDIREMVLDDFGENYHANNLCAVSEHIMNNPIDITYSNADKKLFVVMADGEMAVLNRDSTHGIAAWGRYTTHGYFRAVGASGDKTYVVTERESEFFLEMFSDSEFIDSGEYTYESRACGLPIMTSGHNAKYIRITKIIARVHDTKTMFINNLRMELPNEIYEPDADGFSGDIEMNPLGTLRDMVDCPWEISSDDELPMTILSVTLYGRYQI